MSYDKVCCDGNGKEQTVFNGQTYEIGNCTMPVLDFPIADASDELKFILDKIIKSLSEVPKSHSLPIEQEVALSNLTANRVLLCGRWEDLEPCIESLRRVLQDQTKVLSRVIVATKNAGQLSGDYSKPQIVEWDESVYEEYLIERVKAPTDQFPINLTIDFSPTLRRIERIRQLLEKDGTLIITSEGAGWRLVKPDLISSFSENGGNFIKLTECLDDAANYERHLHLLRPTERRQCPFGRPSFADDTRFSGEKGR